MEEKNSEIKVIVLENDNEKMSTIEDVKIVRIKSADYNLLIMKDYWPVLGEIDGSVYIEAAENYSYENIKGFYSLAHNIFHLIIRNKGE